MDRALEGDETRQLALDLGYVPVVPPKSNRLDPWEYDKALYRKRNEVERLFRRLKGFRRVFSRFDILDVMFTGFVHYCADRRCASYVLTGTSIPLKKLGMKGCLDGCGLSPQIPV